MTRLARRSSFSAEEVSVKAWFGADAGVAVLWSTAAVPADNSDDDLEGDKRNVGMTLHGGSAFRVTELGPGFATPMHPHDECITLPSVR